MTFINRENVGGIDYALQGTVPIGTCDTPAGTETKVASFSDSFDLSSGVVIAIEFTYANTYGDGVNTYPSISIDNVSYPLKLPTGEYAASGAWANGQTVVMLFNGTNFIKLV